MQYLPIVYLFTGPVMLDEFVEWYREHHGIPTAKDLASTSTMGEC